MPSENGSLDKRKRLLNWVWNFNRSKDTPDYNDNMTDVDGYKHSNTLPIGKTRSETWAKQKVHANEVLTPPFLELVNKTAEPFMSTVNDCAAIKAIFFDAKVLLVGEALTLLRPHTGMSLNHVAVRCLLLEDVLKGSISMAQWEKEVLRYAEKEKLLSVCIGTYYQSGTLHSTLIFSVVRYLMALLRQAFVNLW